METQLQITSIAAPQSTQTFGDKHVSNAVLQAVASTTTELLADHCGRPLLGNSCQRLAMSCHAIAAGVPSGHIAHTNYLQAAYKLSASPKTAQVPNTCMTDHLK